MSTLPRITPRSTPLSMTRSTSVPRIRTCTTVTPLSTSMPAIYEVYPPRLPSAPDIPQRVNPLAPPPPTRRTVMLETVQPHWGNEDRALRMKRREHYRYHNAWGKYYYGSAVEQENYRAYTRSVLKQQMADLDRDKRCALVDKVSESEQAVAQDMETRLQDLRDFQRKYTYLSTFRDANKQLMENTWSSHRKQKQDTDRYDREQLQYNPINWSCSLK